MNDAGRQHKRAWEYDAYNFWVEHNGTPEVRAKEDAENPEKMLRKYAAYFDRYEGIKIANICGSCGKKAIPLALLGADVTVFTFPRKTGGMPWRPLRPQTSAFIMLWET